MVCTAISKNMIARISKYELFFSMGDVDIKDETAKKWETQMKVWHHGKEREQVPHFGVCCVQFVSLLKHCSPSSGCTQETQNSQGDRSEKPVWPGCLQITCPHQGHVNRYQQHNNPLIKLKIKQGRTNRKQKGIIRHKVG